MPVFILDESPVFPPAHMADPQGIIAIGGDLSPERLIHAYASGIFPWFSAGEPIMWWSPDPRMVLQPGDLHVSKSMKKLIQQERYPVSMDRRFRAVIRSCAAPRVYQPQTWITRSMQNAYTTLHRLGFAHSVEVWETGTQAPWKNDCLIGGLYGVSLGRCFFGESMFSKKPNVSKLAFITLAETLFQAGFRLIDCQLPTEHLRSLGAREMTREAYLNLLEKEASQPTLRGKWKIPLPELPQTGAEI